ncbi:pilus assembly protein [Pseudescherichia vulneris]|uniref:pilus assembly protein n=1 Tax=Pseudescherichia vulneris TaxID=566 RepID=UPI00227D120F|nr:pilus assembly protein [Pseudescherichia vulneris]WAH54305.1 pilus assembly protein [Pseudescherichia vulneris]
MNALLLKENILTGLLWEAEDISYLDLPTQASFRGMIKANRKLIYRDDEGNTATGYCSKVSTAYEPFALYIKNLFGDGIYFSHESDDVTYLLIIKGGRIVSGTDCFMARSLFDQLMTHLGIYEHLEFTPLTHVQLEAVIERCRLHQLSLKRRRRFIMTIGTCAGAILLALIGTILHLYIHG